MKEWTTLYSMPDGSFMPMSSAVIQVLKTTKEGRDLLIGHGQWDFMTPMCRQRRAEAQKAREE